MFKWILTNTFISNCIWKRSINRISTLKKETEALLELRFQSVILYLKSLNE